MKADSTRYPEVQNIRMTNNIRVFLWVGLALALWLNYTQWQIDYAPKPAASAVTDSQTGTTGAPKAASMEETVPQADPTTAPAPTAVEGAVPVPSPATEPSPTVTDSAGIVRVTTDVMVLDIDLKGGTLVRAELPGYPIVK